jgi:hypothetical protein
MLSVHSRLPSQVSLAGASESGVVTVVLSSLSSSKSQHHQLTSMPDACFPEEGKDCRETPSSDATILVRLQNLSTLRS